MKSRKNCTLTLFLHIGTQKVQQKSANNKKDSKWTVGHCGLSLVTHVKKLHFYNCETFWQPMLSTEYKSDNLQYDMLVRLANGANDSLTKGLTFQVFFFLFVISYRLRALKTLDFHLCNFKKIKKIDCNARQGFCKEFCKIYQKKR